MDISNIQTQPTMDLSDLKKFVKDRIIHQSESRENSGEFPMDILKDIYNMGYMNAYIPKPLGGLGVSTSDLIWIMREIAYGSAGIASTLTASIMGTLPLLLYGSKNLKKEIADRFLEEFTLASFCWTEADSGSDVFHIKTKAVRTKDGYMLTGSKTFASNSNNAHHYLVMAQVEGAEKKSSMTLFYIPKGTPGFSVGKPFKKMGQWEFNTCEVFLEGVFVKNEHRIGNEGEGAKIAVHCLQRNRTLFAAGAIGVSQRAHDIVSNYLLQRELYKKPLLEQPPIRTFLAQLFTELQASWLLVCQSACAWDNNINTCLYSSMAKLFAGHTSVKITSEALELFGGYGYMKEYEIERLYRDAKLYEIAEGPSFVQQLLIAKEIFTPESRVLNLADYKNLVRKAG